MTSKKYGEHLNEMLGIHKKYTLLHDTYHGGYSIEYQGKVNPNTVFCGGRDGRDWEFLLVLYMLIPEITFCFLIVTQEESVGSSSYEHFGI